MFPRYAGFDSDSKTQPPLNPPVPWALQLVDQECTRYLGPNGIGAVQISPVTEHILGSDALVHRSLPPGPPLGTFCGGIWKILRVNLRNLWTFLGSQQPPHLPPKTWGAFWSSWRLGLVWDLSIFVLAYTPGSTNIAVTGKWGPRIESMYFLLTNGGYSSQLC